MTIKFNKFRESLLFLPVTTCVANRYYSEKGFGQAGEWFGRQLIIYYFATLLDDVGQKNI
jgi:hypothetical protein